MSDAPETIWRVAAYLPKHQSYGLSSWPTEEHAGEGATEYRRADLPPTLAQIVSDERVRALVEAGEVMAQALRGGYIVPGSATKWGKALAQLKEAKP